ncbi:MAG: diphthine--ammonia ligase [Candidatus Aenigmatarchaeota archaeon]
MKLAALVSGGKDSLAAVWKAVQSGHEIKYLVTVIARRPDSYMYHTVNIGMVLKQAEVMGIRLVSKLSSGEKEKEVKDLEDALSGLGVEGVVCGAIASEYQRSRVASVCEKLGLKLLAPLWHTDTKRYLEELIENKFEIIITSVAAEGLDIEWLGKKLGKETLEKLLELKKKHAISLVGEGGEYDSVVLDCPLFKKRIEIRDAEKRWQGNSGEYIILDVKLVGKD